MNLYSDQFSDENNFSKVSEVEKTLIIASTPRCGSHMLGHLLYETRCFGFPLEYVNPPNLKKWKKKYNKRKTKDVINEIMNHRTSENGVFGIKIHYSQLDVVGGFKGVQKLFSNPYYVLMSRKDLLKQAVSLAIARQTGVWISGQEAFKTKTKYNFEEIHECLKELVKANASWKYTLAANNCKYIELENEQVRMNPKGAIVEIADFMEVDVPEKSLEVQLSTKKQSTELNRIWLERFYEDYQALPPGDNKKKLI